MVNNFQKIREMLTFPSETNFYFLQILKRRKDNPDLGKDMIHIADYYIFSDPQKLKACCVPGSMLYNFKKTKSNDISVSCNPKHEHFFLYSGPAWNRNYFKEKDEFVMNFIRSVPMENLNVN
jgi:hypothetical protein